MRVIGATKVQMWPLVRKEIYDEIEQMAAKENRKVNEMAAILLENAVKERKRKRKNAKEDQV